MELLRVKYRDDFVFVVAFDFDGRWWRLRPVGNPVLVMGSEE
jgi:hypothetical protein